jgi:hypothetical protein
MKRNLREMIRTKFNMTMMNAEEEARYPEESDRRISDAFVLVKDWLRKNDKEAFWQKHNTEYGFYRNLWGTSWLWIGLNIVFLLISISLYSVLPCGTFLCLVFLNIILNAFSAVIITLFLPKAIQFSADQYAESAWSAFYNLNRQ